MCGVLTLPTQVGVSCLYVALMVAARKALAADETTDLSRALGMPLTLDPVPRLADQPPCTALLRLCLVCDSHVRVPRMCHEQPS